MLLYPEEINELANLNTPHGKFQLITSFSPFKSNACIEGWERNLAELLKPKRIIEQIAQYWDTFHTTEFNGTDNAKK